MAKLLLSGYYGFGNLGDEAILASTVEAVARKDPTAELLVLSANPSETAKSHGVRAFNRMSVTEVVSAMRTSDLVVFGGGSLLQDSTSFRSLAYYIAVIFLAKAFGKPLVVYANGIGPLHSGIGKKLVKAALSTARAITLRDPESEKILKEIELDKPVMVTADPAFMLTAAPSERVEEILADKDLLVSEDIVWLALRGGQSGEFYREFSPAVDFLRSEGFRPALIVMQERDLQVSELLNKTLLSNGSEPLPLVKDLRPNEALGLLKKGAFCFGMRLHTLILSAHAGVPFIGVDIDPKIGAFCRTVGNPVLPDPGRAPLSDLVGELRRFLASRREYEKTLEARLPNLRSMAEENIDMVLRNLGYCSE